MKANELDIVTLTRDLPEYGLSEGDSVVVLAAFTDPREAYDLERVDEGGRSSTFAYSVPPDAFEVSWLAPANGSEKEGE